MRIEHQQELRYRHLEKFLQAAEKNPDGTVYGTTGSISTQRLYMTKLTDRFHGDLKIRHTAYTSGHEVSTALLGKHITAGFQVPANILALCQLRRLQRHRHLPQGTPRPICPIRPPSANCTPTK